MSPPFSSLVPGSARQLGRLLFLYGLLGILAGLLAAAFVTLVDGVGEFLLGAITGIVPTATGRESAETSISWPTPQRYWLLLLPALGGLASGLLCARLAPEAMGTGTGAIIEAYHEHGGQMRRRAPWVKALASSLTIGSGGSAGVEGPVGFIVGGVASSLGRIIEITPQERRTLLMAGFGAGIGAVFHAPMAASIFSAEVLYRDLDLEHEVLVPAIVSSTLSYAVYGAILGWDPSWELPRVEFGHWSHLLPYLVLAGVCALAGGLFVRIHALSERFLGRNRRIPLWLRPMLGGFGVGVIGLVMPTAIGTGYGIAQIAIDGEATIVTLLILAVAKMITSSLTAGSGGAGGLFAPSLVIGGALGGAVALATQAIAPDLDVQTAAFTVVGMAGLFAAVINAPVSTVIMVSEIVGSYRLLVATLWVCAIAWYLLRRVSLYNEQVVSRFQAPGHIADMMGAVLGKMTVSEAMDKSTPPVTVAPDTKLPALVGVFSKSAQGVFPIVDASGALRGVVDGRELRRCLARADVDHMLIADDFRAEALSAFPDDSLDTLVRKMAAKGYDDVVVISRRDPPELLGLLSRREIVTAYYRRMLANSSVAPPAATRIRFDGGESTSFLQALERGGVIGSVDAPSWNEALAAVVEIVDLPPRWDPHPLLEALLHREALGSTYVGDGCVLPHPHIGDNEPKDESRIYLARLDPPVRWDPAATGDDPAPMVRTIIVVLASSRAAHLALLSDIARTLADPGFAALLHDDTTATSLLEHLRSRPRSE